MTGIHFGSVERTWKDEDMISRLSYVTNSQGDPGEGNNLNFLNLIFHIYKIRAKQPLRDLSTLKLKGENLGFYYLSFNVNPLLC